MQIWKELFSERVVPFDLPKDTETRPVKIVDGRVGLSHVLFKPNVLVSTHNLRVFEKGSIIKNLLGLTPEGKKAKYHQMGVEQAILDVYEAVGGIDLAVLDGTHLVLGVAPKSGQILTNVLLVGRDAVAVDAVGAALAGLDPEKMPIIQEAMNRGLGEGNIDMVKIVGASFEDLKERFAALLKAAKKKRKRKASKMKKTKSG